MSKSKLRPTIEIKIEIYKDQLAQANAYEYFISKHIDKGHKIPARVLKKFFSFFKGDDNEVSVIRTPRVNEVFQSVLEKRNTKRYLFSGSKKVKQTKFIPPFIEDNEKRKETAPEYKIVERHYSLEDLLFNVIDKSITQIDNFKVSDKDKVVRIIYSEVAKYKLQNLSSVHKRFLTLYKMRAITASIATSLGYSLTSSKSPTNHDLYDSVRNAVAKLKIPKHTFRKAH